MKKIITIIFAIAMCVSLFAGCNTQAAKETTETTTVLYVEQAGFIAKVSNHTCYVEYVNADKIVAVGDQIELTYWESDHLIASNDRTLGGYQWDTVLVKFSNLVVK